jgi:hypothetical protein
MKNSDRLEEFVKSHRDEFDHLEPSALVWNKIQRNQKKEKNIFIRGNFIRVAAILAVVAISTVILVNNKFFNADGMARITDPELKKLMETEQFYAQKVSGKLEEIRKCYTTFPDIKDEVETDLTELESMYNILKTDLKENISNKPVIEAMIENNRFRLKLVDAVLGQIKC